MIPGKAILKLLPGITFTADRKNDYNSFLVNNHWYEAGAKLSWNLINLVSGPSAIRYALTNEDVAAARRLALRMAVLAQVHVSERQFRNATSQFTQSHDLWLVDRRLAEISDARTENDAQGMLERVATHASAIASQLRRFQTYAQTEQAFAKMQATLGRDLLPDAVAEADLNGLGGVIARRLAAWDRGTDPDPPRPPAVAAPAALATPVVPAATPVASAVEEGAGPKIIAFFVRLFADTDDALPAPESRRE